MQQLLLQKPVGKLTFAASTECLQRRIASWNKGAVRELLRESTTIQHQLAEHRSRHPGRDGPTTDPARKFASNIEQGKLSAAIRQLSPDHSRGVLDLDDVIGEETVRETVTCCAVNILRPSQLPRRHSSKGNHQRNSSQCYSPAWTGLLYVALPYTLAVQPDRPAWMLTDGDGYACTAFGDASEDLCDALACSSRRIATSYINPAALEAFVACRLIPLDKKPSVRTIGIGETVRRIIGKAILGVTGTPFVRQRVRFSSVVSKNVA